MSIRNFQVYRPNDPEGREEDGTGVAPNEVAFEGTIFSDGSVAVRWRTDFRSTSVWNSLDDLLAVHGHPDYDTVIKYSAPWDSQDENSESITEILTDETDDID